MWSFVEPKANIPYLACFDNPYRKKFLYPEEKEPRDPAMGSRSEKQSAVSGHKG